MRRFISPLLALSLAAAAGCARAPRPPADSPPAPAASSPAPADLPRKQVRLPLQYDGVYRSEDLEMEVIGLDRCMTCWSIVPMRQFLRFYPDGRVIEVSTPGETDDVVGFFTAESGLPVGRVTIRDGLLSFSIPDHRGQVDYTGEVRGDSLHLRIHHHADGKRRERVYAFRRGAGIPPPPAPPADLPPPPTPPAELPRAPGNPPLRYDGLYRAEIGLMNPARADETAWAYLRFYPDGTVIYTSQTGPPPHPLPYFTITDEGLPSGTVTVRDALLSFSVRAPGQPAVDYAGEVRNDGLHLRSHSHINGHRAEKVYVFVPGVPDPRPRRTGAP